MNKHKDIQLARQECALLRWQDNCEIRLRSTYPNLNFSADTWIIYDKHGLEKKFNFSPILKVFSKMHHTFEIFLRCVGVEILLKKSIKHVISELYSLRILALANCNSLFSIDREFLRAIEENCLKQVELNQNFKAAGRYASSLQTVRKWMVELHQHEIILFYYHPSRLVTTRLSKLYLINYEKLRAKKAKELNYKIEAFNDALNALVADDPRISMSDKLAIASLAISMCAPSRINEILCMSVDDYVCVDDYIPQSDPNKGGIGRPERVLITMKGSKGANWSAKPALNFMIDAFNFCVEFIKKNSSRSRTLIEWYEKFPEKIYLPPELEHLRDQVLAVADIARIMYWTEDPNHSQKTSTKNILKRLSSKIISIPNPKRYCKDNPARPNPRKSINAVAFQDFEAEVLKDVHAALRNCRVATPDNSYDGKLSKRLFLTDSGGAPYLPAGFNYRALATSLAGRSGTKSLFEKLDIKIPHDGRIEYASMGSHDPRRWLTTQALIHGEKLSDVLINKWANRLSLAQLKSYDFRSEDDLASFSAMPKITELTDISAAVENANKLQSVYGLQSEIVTVEGTEITMTSMEKVLTAVEERPTAKTSEQIILLYPSQYGICLHQHHETACRNYDSCLPCDEGIVVKGHAPTNEEIRLRYEKLRRTITSQLERVILEHNRELADDQDAFSEHIFRLMSKSLNPEVLTDALLDQFHEIKDFIKDKLLRKRIEEAFVARGFIHRSDDRKISSGALIKYHNPKYHSSPGYERALDSNGGREKIASDEASLVESHPQFCSKALNWSDQRHLLKTDDSEDK